MNTSATIGNAVNPMPYGAIEVKELIRVNTRKAFTYTMLLLLLIALYTFVGPIISEWLFPSPNVVRVRLAKISLDALPPPQSQTEEAPPPPPPTNVPSGPAARAGTPVPVPDAELAPDVKDFANVDEINRASAVGGSGEDDGGWASNIGEPIKIEREAEPDPEDFIAVEDEPKYDDIALQRRVQYPDMARRNGIEGMVLVGALIGKNGAIEKIQVFESDHASLNDEAVKAVRETTFTPAKQNGQPVRVWARIPIRFRLR
ncbi:MAG: energy transducer TonB [Candidatus Kapabacteria bacterium]|nr:energy transducer TonB [Candidatus Kapabacteria bacterium]